MTPSGKGIPPPRRVASHIRGKLIAGILALIPLVVTLFVLRLVFENVDDTVQPLVEKIFGRRIIGVGIGLTVVIIYVVGLIATNFVGRRVIRYGEWWVFKVPFVKTVYKVARDVVEMLSANRKAAFKVVLVQWPREGTYTIGLVTGSVVDGDGRRYLHVLIPTTPTPQSGLLAIVPEEEVIPTHLTFEEALKIIISSGFITPENLMKEVKRASKEPRPVNLDSEKQP